MVLVQQSTVYKSSVLKMAKKVYVRPLVTKKKKSRVEKDILLITHAGRVISKAAKKVKAFEAQLIGPCAA